MNVSVGVVAVCPSPGKHWVRPLDSHPLIPIPDDLARALAKLRGRKKRQTLPAACSKRTAAQAGLSAGPPVPEGLLRQVVMGLQPARAENEPMWFSVCTKIANTAIGNGYQDVGLRIFHEFSEQCCAKYDETETDAKFARAVRNYDPQWGFSLLSNFTSNSEQQHHSAAAQHQQSATATAFISKDKQAQLVTAFVSIMTSSK